MIRRWSYINNTNIQLLQPKRFNLRLKINIFKSSVSYKKFVFKITKFKRKSIAKFKHQTNWLLYSNITRNWINDFAFIRHYAKFQFYNKLFVNNFFFFNANLIKMQPETFFFNFNFFFSVWTHRSFYHFNPTFLKYLKNSSITIGWTVASVNTDKLAVPVYHEWDKNLFSLTVQTNPSLTFDLSDIFDFFLNLMLKKHIEFKKILTLLFCHKILNFQNVKLFCSLKCTIKFTNKFISNYTVFVNIHIPRLREEQVADFEQD